MDGNEGGLSVLNWDDASTNANITTGMANLGDYWESVISPDAAWAWDGVVTDIDTATGQKTAEIQLDSQGGPGLTTSTAIMAQNTALLIRWVTGGVVNGHTVKGRTFVPFISRDFGGTKGEPTASVPSITVPSGLVIWARPFTHPDDPTKDRAGTTHAVSLGTPDRGDWATQGSRRRV